MPGRLISFSLYGERPMYRRGMVENAALAARIYKGWGVRCYCENDTPTADLEELGVEVRRMGRSIEHSGMMWRFLPAWEPGIERVIFRDADSRLNVREAAAVADWIASGFAAHVMFDHPHHGGQLIQGGMWGVLGGVLPGWLLPRFIEAYGAHAPKGSDCRHLAREVYPLLRGSMVTHSSVALPRELDWPPRPFPAHEPWQGFVGQQIDDAGKPMWAGLEPATRSGGEVPHA